MECGWWSKNIFKLKEAWTSAGGVWEDTECRIIEARERARLALIERLNAQPARDVGPWKRDELYGD